MAWGTWVVGAALLAVVGLIIYKVVKDRRAGKGGCGCGCETCSACPSGGEYEGSKSV